MDLSSFDLHSDQLPIDQEPWHQQQQRYQIHTPERTTKPPAVCLGRLQEDLFLYDPCLPVQQWADSSPGSVTTNQNPCELKKPQDYPPCSLLFSSRSLTHSAGEDICAFSNSDSTHQHHGGSANVSMQMTTRPDTNPVNMGGPSSDWACDTDSTTPCGFDPRSFYPSPVSQGSHTQCERSPHAKMTVQVPSSPVSLDAWCDHGSPAPGKVDQDPEIDHKMTLESMPELKRHDVPYSKLIETALRQSPDNKLSLQGIYSWFRENTLRGQDKSKGWQNSIRHNLSMNAAFIAVREKSSDGSNVWRLTSHAFKYGVESTTRYRKQANQRKSLASESSASRRQQSGAKGQDFTTTKDTAKPRAKPSAKKDQPYQSDTSAPASVTVKQYQQQQQQRMQQQGPQKQEQDQRKRQQQQQHGQEELPNELGHHRYIPCPTTAPPLPDMGSAVSIGGLSNVLGCADPPWGRPVFCDMGGGSEYLSLDMGEWCEMYSTYYPPNGLSHNGGWTASEISSDLPLGI